MPDMEKLPHSKAAPPIPKVRMRETIIMLRVLERSTLFWIRLLIPKEAIVPNRSNMIHPKQMRGWILTSADFAKNRKNDSRYSGNPITAGFVTFVKDTAPVTSEYVVTGGPPTNPAKTQARPHLVVYDVSRGFSRNLYRQHCSPHRHPRCVRSRERWLQEPYR